MSSTFPNLSKIPKNVSKTIKSRAGKNITASNLLCWIRVVSAGGVVGEGSTSTGGLVLESFQNKKDPENSENPEKNWSTDNFSTRYGNGSKSGRVGTNFQGDSVYADGNDRAYRPSPIIEGLSIQNGNKGLSRKSTFTIKCFSLGQVEKISQFFLEPGYTVLVEFGWNTALAKSVKEPVLSPCNIARNNNFVYTNGKRKKSEGHYDSFLGYITGGGIKSGDGETYLCDVELTTLGEIPTYLQQHKGDNQAGDTKSQSDLKFKPQEIKNEENIGKSLFMQMYNKLPAAKQTPNIMGLIDDADGDYHGTPWYSAHNFLNIDDEVREKVVEGYTDTSVSVKNEDGSDKTIDGLTLQDARVQLLRTSYKQLAETMAQFGPTGAIVAGVAQGSLSIMTAMENQVAGNKAIADAVADTTNNFGENDIAMAKGAQTAEMVGGVMSGVGQMLAANSKGQIAELDQQIAAEKRRDGKSKESLAKIAQMEKKKEAMQKKAFEQNKKVQMAVTIANTAASIMAALSAPPIGLGPIAGMPMAIMAGAMGALQLAVIAKSKYQGGGGGVQQPSATKLSIGKRNNSVDVSRGSSAGELSYMRGERGVGSNANNFTPGGAMGRKGYASGGEGILVGERGPEIVTPSQKVDIIPNDRLGGNTNVNFSINAVDSAGVEDLLVNQRGNIIRMIREAANENGEDFLTQVDPMAYGSNS